MLTFRCKELQQAHGSLDTFFQIHTHEEQSYLNNLMPKPTKASHESMCMSIQPHVVADAGLEGSWMQSKCLMSGGNACFQHLIRHPITDVHVLRQRQRAIRHVARHRRTLVPLLKRMMHLHRHILWLRLKTPQLHEFPMSALYPSWFATRWLNKIPMFHVLFHSYRLWVSPFFNLVYPLSILIAPWWYLRKMLRMHLPFLSYLTMVRSVVWTLIKANFTRMITFFVYIGIYLYGVVQSIDFTLLLHRLKRSLQTKSKHISEFLRVSDTLFTAMPSWIWETFDFTASHPTSLPSIATKHSNMYEWCTSASHQSCLEKRLKRVYLTDALMQCAMLMKTKRYCYPKFSSQHDTQFIESIHPSLVQEANGNETGIVTNPIHLQKNLIVTGPNACGKTTYIRSILANIILAQTFGIACATRGTHRLVKGLCSFMRLSDEVGHASLFEAELNRCLSIEKTVKELLSLHPDDPVVIFLDEPMHATPPLEGESTACAFIRYIATLSDRVRCIVTTHHAYITTLESDDPDRFCNVSMDAIVSSTSMPSTPSGTMQITFPYTLRKGASHQSIALEMLQQRQFPMEFIEDAIKIKNKICQRNVNV